MDDNDGWPYDVIVLFRTPGLVQTLLEMHELGGTATAAQLRAAGVRYPEAALSRLTASGHVTGSAGSLDDMPRDDSAAFTLTYDGAGLAGVLGQLASPARIHRLGPPKR